MASWLEVRVLRDGKGNFVRKVWIIIIGLACLLTGCRNPEAIPPTSLVVNRKEFPNAASLEGPKGFRVNASVLIDALEGEMEILRNGGALLITLNGRHILWSTSEVGPPHDVWIDLGVLSDGDGVQFPARGLNQLLTAAYPGASAFRRDDKVYVETEVR